MKNIIGLFVTLVTLASCEAVTTAQEPTKIARVGFLAQVSSSAISARIDAFRQGLRERGYIEGQNLKIEWRDGGGDAQRLGGLAAELVRMNVDVIVTAGPTATRAAKEATVTIPIVMGFDNDPVGSGFVASLARPGGNITGLSALSPELSGKRLELLKEIAPKLTRVATLGTSTEPGNALILSATEVAAKALGIDLKYLDVKAPKDVETALREATKGRAEAVLVLQSPVVNFKRLEIVEYAAKNRLLGMYPLSEFVESGGLVSYAPRFIELFRRAATYVDKILKGTKPAGLPVEQPTKFEFIINLKAAKQIGLTIPPNVLARADRVIK
jgi:putative tryptophan/tyrosine transport system substrate-binding protein